MRPFLVAVLFAAGCAGAPSAGKPPKWVTRGSGVFKEAGEPAVFGVGADDAAAKAECGRILDGFQEPMITGYMATTHYDHDEFVDQTQHMGQTLKNLLVFTRHRIVIVDHWKSPVDGTAYALATVGLKGLQETIDDSRELDPKVMKYVTLNARKHFLARAKR